MVQKIRQTLRQHEHWFAEFWSMLFLFIVGFYGLTVPKTELLRNVYTHGFLSVLPDGLWQMFFILAATLQCMALFRPNLFARGIAAFMGATLLIWGGLNVIFYGSGWHFSLIAWGFFAAINLYALSRILTGIERKARGKVL